MMCTRRNSMTSIIERFLQEINSEHVEVKSFYWSSILLYEMVAFFPEDQLPSLTIMVESSVQEEPGGITQSSSEVPTEKRNM